MRRLRHGLVQRSIVLLLAAAMPLCCCTLRAAHAESISEEVPIVKSCCSASACAMTETSEGETPAEPCSSCGSSCCVKVIGSMFDWTPPVDDLGVLDWTAAVATASLIDLSETVPAIVHRGQACPPGPWGSSAPSLRRVVILQV